MNIYVILNFVFFQFLWFSCVLGAGAYDLHWLALGALVPIGVLTWYSETRAADVAVAVVALCMGAMAATRGDSCLPAARRTVGIVHILDYLRFRKQALPVSNAVVQFFCGFLVIVSGNSVDREGPGVHLGAATSSLLGMRIKLTEDESYLHNQWYIH